MNTEQPRKVTAPPRCLRCGAVLSRSKTKHRPDLGINESDPLLWVHDSDGCQP